MMTVKDLIEKLSLIDPQATVHIQCESRGIIISEASIDEIQVTDADNLGIIWCTLMASSRFIDGDGIEEWYEDEKYVQ